MKKYTLILAGFVALGGLSATAADRKPFGNGELPEIMKPFDIDGDGKLSAEERQAFEAAVKEKRQAELLEKFDADGDGKLSEAELKAAREAARQKVEDRRTDRFDELDADDDGFLSTDEFKPPVNLPEALVARMFAHLDKNSDGKISKEEFLKACRRPGEQPPPPPPPGGDGGTPPALPEWLKPYDVNNNNILEPAEQAAVRAAIESGALVPPRR
jgi:Ca2+-binding EF-hand superfamily protein